MVHYKLFYFNARGRAEPIRFIFAASGNTFEDVRFERDQWPQYKLQSPSGQCPFLEVTQISLKTLINDGLFYKKTIKKVSEGERLSSAHRKPSAIKTEYNEKNFSLGQSSAIGKFKFP
jgi:hypothetical protein